MHKLPPVVANAPPGSKVAVTLMRKGREKTVQLTVAELPEEPTAAAPAIRPQEGPGMVVQELTPEIARSVGVSPQTQGVVVTRVQEGSPAEDAGVQPGDVILEVNQQKIHSLREYRAALGRVKGSNRVLFLVRRGDDVVYIAMKPG